MYLKKKLTYKLLKYNWIVGIVDEKMLLFMQYIVIFNIEKAL